MSQTTSSASIFISCLVDNFYPEVGISMVNVLRRLGVDLSLNRSQTCCGQPAYNTGYQEEAREVAKHFLDVFSESDCAVICPSGSCTTMVKVFYRDLFSDEPGYREVAEKLASSTYEFTDYLVNVLKVTDVGAEYNGKVTYHDSCHLLRELGLKDEPRKLISSVKGIDFVEMDMHDACCGFGGTFSVKLPHVSNSMLEEKIQCAIDSGAESVVSTDMGCLMNINGYIKRNNIDLKTMHIAQLLDNHK